MKKCIAFAALTAIFFCLLLAGCALEGPAESAGSVSGHSESSAPNDAEASGGELAQTPSGPHTDHIESIGGDAALRRKQRGLEACRKCRHAHHGGFSRKGRT